MRPSRISTKIKIVGGLLSLMIFVIIILTVAMNERSKKDSLIINIAGKQRMLTQKMAKEIFFIRHRDMRDFRFLNSAMDQFESNLNNLTNGNASAGIYPPQSEVIRNKLNEVKSIWDPFRKEIINIKEGVISSKKDKQVLTQRIQILLSMSDQIVKEMVKVGLPGSYIDDSGRQRMLTQRMGLYVERYLRTDNEEDFLYFVGAKNLYDKTITKFINDLEIKKHRNLKLLVEDTYKNWKEYQTYLLALLKIEDRINDSIGYIYQHNVKLLDTMDEAVWLYTEHSENKNRLFLNSLYIVAVLAMVIILYTFTLAKDIVIHIDEFVQKAKSLTAVDLHKVDVSSVALAEHNTEEELKEATHHKREFVRKVNVAMQHSEEAISRAENAVNELSAIAEDVELALNDLNIDENEKNNFDKKVNATEDIAIESTENLMHVTQMLSKLKDSLNRMVEQDELSSKQ